MMGAADNDTVRELSARARLDRVALDAVERAGVGAWLVTRENDRQVITRGGRDFVKNGDLWEVEPDLYRPLDDNEEACLVALRHEQERWIAKRPAGWSGSRCQRH